MLENLLEKYLKSGKDYLIEEYGTYKGKMTIMTVDEEDAPFTHQLIEVAKSHPEVYDSYYDTFFGDPCIAVIFKCFEPDDYLIEEDGEDGALLYPISHLSFDEFKELLPLVESNTYLPKNDGYYIAYWKDFSAELRFIDNPINQIQIHVRKDEDFKYMEIYPEDVTVDEISDLNGALTILKKAIDYFA